MKRLLFIITLPLALAACGGEEPPTAPRAQVPAQAPVEAQRQAERAADAGKPLADESLTQIVQAALRSESSLDAQKIDVENRGGEVTLHGEVASEEQKEKAARIVASVGGVRSVTNNLAVDGAASAGSSAPLPGSSALPEK